jgi:toxin CptA
MFLPLELTLRPSRIYAAVLLPAAALASAGIGFADLPTWVRAVAATGLLAGMAQAWRQQKSRPLGLRISQSGQMEILLDDWQAANIQGQAVVLPWLISLTAILENGAAKKLVLWPDSADADTLRKLRVWLKWGNSKLV